jgi:hypothetical protein
MRFNDHDPDFAIVRFGEGKAIKVDAAEALLLPGRVYQFNEQLFQLLATALENRDQAALDDLWNAAHPYVRPKESGGMQTVNEH